MGAVAGGVGRVTIRSGHGVGKTTLLAWTMLWYVSTRIPVKVVVTAPSASQLFDAVMAETKVWLRRMPEVLSGLWDIKTDRIELRSAPEESFISARTSRSEQPEALAGVHSGNGLLIVDEASGVPGSGCEAAGGGVAGGNGG